MEEELEYELLVILSRVLVFESLNGVDWAKGGMLRIFGIKIGFWS